MAITEPILPTSHCTHALCTARRTIAVPRSSDGVLTVHWRHTHGVLLTACSSQVGMQRPTNITASAEVVAPLTSGLAASAVEALVSAPFLRMSDYHGHRRAR